MGNSKTFIEPEFENIPQELKTLNRWVTWRAESDSPTEKPKKIPYDPNLPNSRASSTDPSTWGSFEQAEAAYHDGDRTGIGFVLNNDGIVGVDVDNCDTPEKVQQAVALLDSLNATYVEYSPSGQGLRAFGYAPPLKRGAKGKIDGMDVEVYSTGRYLTLTGKTVKSTGIGALQYFDELAAALSPNSNVNQETGEVQVLSAHDKHAELIRRVLDGDVYHDSLRDLAASFIANGMNGGAAVSQLRALMSASRAEKDGRWESRYKDIPRLVMSAQEKFSPLQVELKQTAEGVEIDLFERLGVVRGDEVNGDIPPPDELVQDVITKGSSSVFYGDSNSGKTFLAIDMCCAIALGRDWMGKKTEQNIALYLATESANSVLTRINAYQKFHQVKLENLYVVTVPLNFFRSDDDIVKVVELIKRIEEERGMKVAITVSDTLARIASGANENSGTDMSPVMERFDYLARLTGTHSLAIHHSGKDQAKGARGWSGIRAHIDTEIEITELKDGVRSAEITKQRELSSKNTAIYFKLHPVEIGVTKFGAVATTCVVEEATDYALEEDTKEPKTLSKSRQLFEQAVMACGRIDHAGDIYISADEWNEYTKTLDFVSDGARRNALSRAKKDLVEGALISAKGGGYIAEDMMMKSALRLHFNKG